MSKNILEAVLSKDVPHTRPWPVSGRSYDLIIEVEHIGNWDDTPAISIIACPEDVESVFEDLTLREACADDYRIHHGLPDEDRNRAGATLPIASGTYKVRLEFWFHDCTPWDAAWPEYDYGFYVLALERLP